MHNVQSGYAKAALLWSSMSISANSISAASKFCRAIRSFAKRPPLSLHLCAIIFRTCLEKRVSRTGSSVFLGGFALAELFLIVYNKMGTRTIRTSTLKMSSTPKRSRRSCGDALCPTHTTWSSSLSAVSESILFSVRYWPASLLEGTNLLDRSHSLA